MNTRAFQRLRRIRQLALAYFVYPGAQHTRFEHSVGAMHLAGRICERLRGFGFIDEPDTRLVRLAALLHDIGHGPFSHVSDFLLERHCDREKVPDVGAADKIHEKITADIILKWPEFQLILSEDKRQAIAGLIVETPKRQFERDIVSSSLDADKMDYLLRDSHFAGVEYGHFDLEKMIEACRVITRGDESYLAIHHEGIYALEQLVLAKHHMSQQVYFHRIRAITDAMLVRGLSLAISSNVDPVASLFRYDGSEAFIERYLEFHDDRLIQLLCECEHEKVRDMFSRLRDRRLLKQVCSLPLEDVKNAFAKDNLSALGFESDATHALEDGIAAVIGADRDLVIVNLQSIKNPTYRSPSYRLDAEEIMVLDEKGNPQKVTDFEGSIFSLNTSVPVREVVRVFAPKDEWSDPEDRKFQERTELENRVKELILESVR